MRILTIVWLIVTVLFTSAAIAEDVIPKYDSGLNQTPFYNLYVGLIKADNKQADVKVVSDIGQAAVSEKKITKKMRKHRHIGKARIKSALVKAPWQWKHPGGDKYSKKPLTKAQIIAGLKKFSMSEQYRQLLINAVMTGEWEWKELARGDEREEMLTGSGPRGKRPQDDGVIVAISENVLQATRRFQVKMDDGRFLVLDNPLVCSNLTWGFIVPKPPSPPTEETPPAPPTEETPPAPPTEETPPAPPTVRNVYDEFEFYLGGGGDNNVHYDHTHGWYLWGKLRYRPIRNRMLGNWKSDTGFFLTASNWGGDVDHYWYEGYRIGGGLSNKIYNKNIEFNSDIGIGRQYDKGGIDLYENGQKSTEVIGTISYDNQKRRNSGKKLAPRHGAYLDFIISLSNERDSSFDGQPLNQNSDNPNYGELGVQLGIYDFLNGPWRITPGFNWAIGHNWGIDKSYYKIGPNVIVSAYKNDILNINFLNYKEELGGRGDEIWWASGFWDVTGSWRAIKAHRTKAATQKKIEAKRAAALQSN